jgi:hypothetical protein
LAWQSQTILATSVACEGRKLGPIWVSIWRKHTFRQSDGIVITSPSSDRFPSCANFRGISLFSPQRRDNDSELVFLDQARNGNLPERTKLTSRFRTVFGWEPWLTSKFEIGGCMWIIASRQVWFWWLSWVAVFWPDHIWMFCTSHRSPSAIVQNPTDFLAWPVGTLSSHWSLARASLPWLGPLPWISTAGACRPMNKGSACTQLSRTAAPTQSLWTGEILTRVRMTTKCLMVRCPVGCGVWEREGRSWCRRSLVMVHRLGRNLLVLVFGRVLTFSFARWDCCPLSRQFVIAGQGLRCRCQTPWIGPKSQPGAALIKLN